MSWSSVRSETALRSRLFSSSSSFSRFSCSIFAKFLAPAIVGHLAHTNLTDCIRHNLLLRDQNIASLVLPSSLMSETYLKSDHFVGGG
jgi:hypothetical protein